MQLRIRPDPQLTLDHPQHVRPGAPERPSQPFRLLLGNRLVPSRRSRERRGDAVHDEPRANVDVLHGVPRVLTGALLSRGEVTRDPERRAHLARQQRPRRVGRREALATRRVEELFVRDSRLRR